MRVSILLALCATGIAVFYFIFAPESRLLSPHGKDAAAGREEVLSDASTLGGSSAEQTQESEQAIGEAHSERSSEYAVDPTRLYDVGYQESQAIAELAQYWDVSPECAINRMKRRYGDETASTEMCLPLSVGQQVLRTNAAYAAMPLDELQALAMTDAIAAVELGERAKRDLREDDALDYFERAIALSGRTGILADLVFTHGFHWEPRESAAKTYEYMLVAESLGRRSSAAFYRDNAIQQGVDVALVEKRALERVNRIMALRLELVGKEWGED